MSTEYFSTIAEALQVFTDQKRARDFQEFVIAMAFCKKFDTRTYTGESEVAAAIEDFIAFLKPINSIAVTTEIHTQIQERATSLEKLLETQE